MENDHWSRALQALGHTVRLMPQSYPKTPSGMDWHYKAESLHR
jgi:predicted alpha/beta hydrolase family esterase